jgi:hypothetical protein
MAQAVLSSPNAQPTDKGERPLIRAAGGGHETVTPQEWDYLGQRAFPGNACMLTSARKLPRRYELSAPHTIMQLNAG